MSERDDWEPGDQTADDRDIGWGDDLEGADTTDDDVERLIADRPPHHERGDR